MPNSQQKTLSFDIGAPAHRVAILGHHGIPGNYGGFETFAEKITGRLVKLGCEVTVYCRSNHFVKRPSTHQGARLIYLPTIAQQELETPIHSLLSVLNLLWKNTADTIIMVNVGNALFAGLAKLFGKKVIFCVDGLDWERKKWGPLARFVFKTSSYLAKWVAHEVVTDALSVQEFYRSERNTASTHIAYGGDLETISANDTNYLQELGLESKKYFIFIARFEPENNPEMVVRAYVASGSNLPLVMIGDNRYNQDLIKNIKEAANSNVKFLGYTFGARYKQLARHALASARASEVGGSSPAVIETMGRGVCILANDRPVNREVLREAGLFFDIKNPITLTALFKQLSDDPQLAITLGNKARERVAQVYNWDSITYAYWDLIDRLQEKRSWSKESALFKTTVGSTSNEN